MIAVEVRKKDVRERERDAVAHHLPLRAFAAIEQQRLSLADDGERGNAAFDRWTGRGRTEKSNGQRHGRSSRNIVGSGWWPRSAGDDRVETVAVDIAAAHDDGDGAGPFRCVSLEQCGDANGASAFYSNRFVSRQQRDRVRDAR